MKKYTPVSYAVMAILMSARGGAVHAQEPAEPAASDESIGEIIVTATRRSENIQNVPIAIQALTSETIKQLNVTTFDDYVKFLPNVTGQGLAPGQNNVYMRGLSTGVTGLQGVGVVGPFPNVAIYLDDQSGQVPGRNLDIYAADLERIEVLEGPQGTLFGAGAQAGVVRYITNKPKLNTTEANFTGGYATTAHGADSNSIEGVLNLGIIEDKFAIRGVVYNETRGGYIDNIPGTFRRGPADLGVGYQYGACPQTPANSTNCATLSNANIASNDINKVAYKGVRVSALYQFNDDWNALITQSYQNLDVDGVFAQQETAITGAFNTDGSVQSIRQPALTVQLYNPSFATDRFSNTAWTLNGRIGMLKAVYTGGYLVRNVEQVNDYTNYARGPYMNYYQCVAAAYTTDGNARCFSPSATWHDIERNTHQSHEFRLSTPDDKRLRAIGGLFWEDYKIQEQVDWHYKSAVDYFRLVAPPLGFFEKNGSPLQGPTDPRPGRPWRYADFLADPVNVSYVPSPATANNPNVRDPTIGFFDDITRGYKQKAAFASVDFDILPSKLTLTLGTRYYEIEATEVGSAIGSFGCKLFTGTTVTPGETCTAGNGTISPVSNGGNLDSLGLDETFTGFKSRANLSYRITDDVLVYATWSQGFRSGGFNRPNSVETASPLVASPDAIAHGGWFPPVDYAPDTLTNNEIGWKTEWLNRRIQFNGAVYKEEWKDAQIAIFDPGVTGNLTFSANGGTFEVKGLETSVSARVTRGLTVSATAAWNQSELTTPASFVWNDGTPIDFSRLTDANGNPLSTPGGDKGSPLSSAPPFQGSLRIRQDFALGDYEAFWQLAGTHQAHSLATTDRLTLDLEGNSIAYDLPGFSLFDASLGVAKDAWAVQLYGQNITDKQAALYANARQWYKAVTVTRPRTLGLRFSYNFSGK